MTEEIDYKKVLEENDRLQKICMSRTDMVSVSMHQVRTAMSALKWIIKMFLNGDLGQLTPEQKNLLQKAFDSNERAITIANELLHFNKTEDITGKDFKLEEFDINELIDNALFDFFGEARDKKIEMIFPKPQHDFPKITADKERIQIVLQNLIENSLKYSDDDSKVFLTLNHDMENVQFSITNHGTIITPESKDKIFQKFYRSPEAQKKEIVGSGLGLYTIKKIVENEHKGKIWFESSEKDGTTFFFTIPIKQSPIA